MQLFVTPNETAKLRHPKKKQETYQQTTVYSRRNVPSNWFQHENQPTDACGHVGSSSWRINNTYGGYVPGYSQTHESAHPLCRYYLPGDQSPSSSSCSPCHQNNRWLQQPADAFICHVGGVEEVEQGQATSVVPHGHVWPPQHVNNPLGVVMFERPTYGIPGVMYVHQLVAEPPHQPTGNQCSTP
eukprot:GHVS01058002.1.p1 GENE.GHVS01058002.1~~GHVS01058002.1.p1  ORF type:complete len:185 (-),score=17.61 GHVS01058002.1:103-657(-)